MIDVGMNRISEEGEARELFGDEAERRVEIIGKRGYTLVGDVHPAEADESSRMAHACTWRCRLAHCSYADAKHGQGCEAEKGMTIRDHGEKVTQDTEPLATETV